MIAFVPIVAEIVALEQLPPYVIVDNSFVENEYDGVRFARGESIGIVSVINGAVVSRVTLELEIW